MIAPFLPVCRPQLPPAAALSAYLQESDAARHYTNRGPLVQRLEARLVSRLGLASDTVRTASNGTSAIEVAILAAAGPASEARPYALIPSYTFAATALAAERCGYKPLFCDVDPVTWAMDLAAAARHPLLDKIGLILLVAPYGRRPQIRQAEALYSATGIAVVVDAAACFEHLLDDPSLVSATVPMTISFHATKTFSTGEGGAVLWNNPAGQALVVQAANFGFNYSRRSETAGTNAKMSDLHAAVGLAMLDTFEQRRADYAATVALWAELAAPLPGALHLPPDLGSVYILWQTPTAQIMDQAIGALTAANIDSRRWYEDGLHRQPHFQRFGGPDLQSIPLPVTEDLGGRLLGLPMAHDLSRDQIARVVGVLQSVL
jgi:dTDP-4-amino-4,6-dideoxygalactose transaminase